MTQRLQFILIGLLGGLAFWGLFDAGAVLRETWAFVPMLVLAAAFFFAALAMLGELGLRKGLALAGAIAAVAAGLAALKGLAFASGGQMLETGHVVVALVAVATIPVPFAVAFGLEGRAGLRDYRVLFIESWNIVVRYLAAWLFVGVVLLVLWLMGALLDLVGVTVLSALMRDDLALWLIAGGTLGLGFSVVTEMPDMVSPYLLLRLMRLLAPPVAVVELIFVAALPVRGLGHLFGDLSAATALLATALASVLLVSIVVDQDEVEAAHGRVLAWSARGLMGLLPVLAGLAAWALALRVGQYGWTPDRVAAVALAAVVAGYALGYAWALTGRRWMARVRQANIGMAVFLIGLAGLWLTPALSPEGIAARSQLARFAAGQATVDQLALWQMQHDWGLAGERAIARLRGLAQADPALAARLDRLATAQGPWEMAGPVAAEAADLASGLAVLPEGAALPEGLAGAIALGLTPREVEACAAQERVKPVPCLVVLADLSPVWSGPEAVFLHPAQRVAVFALENAAWRRAEALTFGAGPEPLGVNLIGALLAGPVTTEPVDLRALQAGDWRITVTP